MHAETHSLERQVAELHSQLTSLRVRSRRHKAFCLAVAVSLCAIGLISGQSGTDRKPVLTGPLEATSFVLKDKNGIPRAILGMDAQGMVPGLWLYDESGRFVRASVTGGSPARALFYGERDQPVFDTEIAGSPRPPTTPAEIVADGLRRAQDTESKNAAFRQQLASLAARSATVSTPVPALGGDPTVPPDAGRCVGIAATVNPKNNRLEIYRAFENGAVQRWNAAMWMNMPLTDP